MPKLLTVGPDQGPVLLLAHGAGAGMASPFMAQMADPLSANGLCHGNPCGVRLPQKPL